MSKAMNFTGAMQLDKIIEVTTLTATTSLAMMKQISLLQFEAAQTWLQQSAAVVKAMVAATSPQQLTESVKQFTTDSLQSGSSQSKQIAEVMSSSQEAYVNVATDMVKEVQASLASSVATTIN